MEYCLGIEVQPEPYMELRRRILFVVFAVVSYVYRWVVTFAILKFMATVPEAVQAGSDQRACWRSAALASMVGWPLYRLVKNVHKRGRLPDMKPVRVTVSAALVAARAVRRLLRAAAGDAHPRARAACRCSRRTSRRCTSRCRACSKKLLRQGRAVRSRRARSSPSSTSLELEKPARRRRRRRWTSRRSWSQLYDDQLNKEHDPRARRPHRRSSAAAADGGMRAGARPAQAGRCRR